MNRTGDGPFGFIKYLVILGFFMILFSLGLAGFVNSMGAQALSLNVFDGISSFFIANMVLWILIAAILSAFVVVYLGRSNQ